MSQEKAQLIAPIGIMTVSGMTATGVITATSFTGNVVGSAKSLVNGTDVTAGVVTGTSFVGNLTGNIQRLADSAPNINVGVTTATSFVGNLTGSVTDLTSQPAITVGLVTASSLSGPITGNVKGNVVGDVTGNITGDVDGDVTGNITGTISGNVTGTVTGNATGLAGGLGINYNGGWTGAGTSQLRVGVITATTFHGDGSNLSGVTAGPTTQQSIGITSAATTIDLSNGNVIYATQSASTVISFTNAENGYVYFIRKDDNSGNYRGITWPTGIGWSGGAAPNLVTNTRTSDVQVFTILTRDMGVTWYGREVVRIDPINQFFAVGQGGGTGGNAQNNNKNISSPIQISGTTWVRGAITGQHGMGIKSDGTMWVWGDNGAGAVGSNNRTQYSSPVQVGARTAWNVGELSLAGSGDGQFFVVDTSAQLWVWGDNLNGSLGLNEGYPGMRGRSSPAQLPGSWSKPFGGTNGITGAIKNSNELWVWGNNDEGQLGQNSKTQYSSPKQIPGTWSEAAAGYGMAAGFKTDGTLWAWGLNTYGRLGLNNTTSYSSPMQIGSGDGNWKEMTGRSGYGFAVLKTDGTMWAWGLGSQGNLGQNDNTHQSSPVQVPGTTWDTFSTKCVGNKKGGAIKTDGTLWTWSYSSWGELGQNGKWPGPNASFSSPTQVGGFNDCTSFAFGNYNMVYARTNS